MWYQSHEIVLTSNMEGCVRSHKWCLVVVLSQRTAEHLEQALTYYQKVLQMHPDNIYAANGVGAILAEQVGNTPGNAGLCSSMSFVFSLCTGDT